jgi:hypothetical protein
VGRQTDLLKGQLFFSDFIWRINTEEGTIKLLYSFDQEKFGLFDVINVEITDEDEFILFRNKRDLTLWSLNLKELEGGARFTPESPVDF